MDIVIPYKHKYGQQVKKFLDFSLSKIQLFETYEKIETYQKFTALELIRTNKIEKISEDLYELKVPIAQIKLRFFGILQGNKLTLIHVFKKKSQKIPKRELQTVKNKAFLFK